MDFSKTTLSLPHWIGSHIENQANKNKISSVAAINHLMYEVFKRLGKEPFPIDRVAHIDLRAPSSLEPDMVFQVHMPIEVGQRAYMLQEKGKTGDINQTITQILMLAALDQIELNQKKSKSKAVPKPIFSHSERDTYYLQQKECDRVTSMYRKAIESQYDLEAEYRKNGYWGMIAFIPLGQDRCAFINQKDQVVWAYLDEIDTNQLYFTPSLWCLESSNWDGLTLEHPAIAHELEVIDASNWDKPNITMTNRG